MGIVEACRAFIAWFPVSQVHPATAEPPRTALLRPYYTDLPGVAATRPAPASPFILLVVCCFRPSPRQRPRRRYGVQPKSASRMPRSARSARSLSPSLSRSPGQFGGGRQPKSASKIPRSARSVSPAQPLRGPSHPQFLRAPQAKTPGFHSENDVSPLNRPRPEPVGQSILLISQAGTSHRLRHCE